MSERRSRLLVVDTSVAVKFYVPEAGHEEAVSLLDATDSGDAELLAPDTLMPEGFNAIFQQERRGLLTSEEARGAWERLLQAPIYTYATGDLIERAAELYFETGVIIYDALFLALAEASDTVVVTEDRKLLKRLEGTEYARLARSLGAVRELI